MTLTWLVVIGLLTLRPAPADAEAAARLPWTCLYPCGDMALRDAILNVALFLPLGWGLAHWIRPRSAFLACALTTVSIEFIQYHWLVGRDASLRDILTNATGGLLGILLAGREAALVLPGPRAARRLLLAGGGAWSLLVLGSAWLVRPTLPATVWWGQWAPELGQFDTWDGQVLAAAVAGLPFPSGRLANSSAFRERLLRDSALVVARVVAGRPPARLAPVVSMFDSDQREVMVLGQIGRGVAFRLRTRMRDVELGDLTAWLPNVPPYQLGDTLTLVGGVEHGAWQLGIVAPGGSAWRRIPFSAGLLWAGLWPFHPLLGPWVGVLSGLWLGASVVPVGWWAGRAGDLGVLTGLVAMVILMAVARGTGLAFPDLAELAGVMIGGTAAGLAGAASRRHWPAVPVD